jgi:hypothetical protein
LQQPAQERGAFGARRLSHEPILADSPTQKCVNDHSRSQRTADHARLPRIRVPRAYSASVASPVDGRRRSSLSALAGPPKLQRREGARVA